MTPEEVAAKSRALIDKKGYVFWQCEALNNEVICIVKNGGFFRDRATDAANHAIKKGWIKEMPVFYSEQELKVSCESGAVQMMHEAKKAGATLVAEDT